MRHLRVLSILLSIVATFAAACSAESGASGPDTTSVAFSVGGSECSVTEPASVFEQGVPIHTVLTMSPALPTGGTVTITVEKDGVEVAEAGGTVTVAEPAPCIWGTLPDLDIGHYRMTYAIDPSQMPPATGEFDVIPAA